MTTKTVVRATAGCLAGGAALAALGYAACAGAAWTRYGHATRARHPDEDDSILDRFMPLYDIVERHHVRVAAPAAVTLAVACDLSLSESRVARAIFKGRELMLGGDQRTPPAPPGLLASMLALGWARLAEEDGREVVLGAVTRPWEANPMFRALPPPDFTRFAEPDYVKIAWTLRADPAGDEACVFRTETRAIATDVEARAKFRRYWALVSPGVALIRRAMLVPVKQEAERRVASAQAAPAAVPVS